MEEVGSLAESSSRCKLSNDVGNGLASHVLHRPGISIQSHDQRLCGYFLRVFPQGNYSMKGLEILLYCIRTESFRKTVA
jgi:hypothetical protein